MAKLELTIKGDLNDFLGYLKKEIVTGSVSASIEEESYINLGQDNVAIMAFERYSYFGRNRVGLTVVIVDHNGDLIITAISTGGSSAVFFKINTVGEKKFLAKLREAIEKYQKIR